MGGSPVWKRNDCWKDADKVMKGLGLRLSTDTGDWLSASHTEFSGTRKKRKMQPKTLLFRSISLCEISVTSPNFGLGFTASLSIAHWLAYRLQFRNCWTKSNKLIWLKGLMKTLKALSLPVSGLSCWTGQFNNCHLSGERFSC
jgi:hypothetical protein